MEIGFCGPGLMGAPMIRRLLRAGHTVHVWNRSRAKAEALVADGACLAHTPAELARACDAVLLCLADAAAVEAVVFGPQGIALGARGGAGRPRWLADHSSIAPGITRIFAQRLVDDTGMAWVDAPVSGGVPGAVAGTLAVMAGGAAETIQEASAVMQAYAARVTHMGPVGAGQTTKLCNQAVVSATLTAIAEAVSLARDSHIDAARLVEALAGGWADSVLLRIFVPRMVQPGAEPIVTVRTMQKDVDAIAALAAETGTPMPLATQVRQLLHQGTAAGLAQADLAVLTDILRRQAPAARQDLFASP